MIGSKLAWGFIMNMEAQKKAICSGAFGANANARLNTMKRISAKLGNPSPAVALKPGHYLLEQYKTAGKILGKNIQIDQMKTGTVHLIEEMKMLRMAEWVIINLNLNL